MSNDNSTAQKLIGCGFFGLSVYLVNETLSRLSDQEKLASNVKFPNLNDDQLTKLAPGIYGFKNDGNIQLANVFEKRHVKITQTTVAEDEKTKTKYVIHDTGYEYKFAKIATTMSLFLPKANYSELTSLFPSKILNNSTKGVLSQIQKIAEEKSISLIGFDWNTTGNFRMKFGEISKSAYPNIYYYVESCDHLGPKIKYVSPNAKSIAEYIYPVAGPAVGAIVSVLISGLFIFS